MQRHRHQRIGPGRGRRADGSEFPVEISLSPLHTEEGTLVMTAGPENKVAPRPVKAGEWYGKDWVILGGLNAGDKVIIDGVLQGYFLSTYSARKMGMQTTGNAGGSHNLLVKPGQHDLAGLIKQMDRGLLVTELLGHGVNYVTGDYSRGAAGFWVENGIIQYPVHEITIAGNLKDMLMGIREIGSDVLVRGSKHCGSILVERMTVAGA